MALTPIQRALRASLAANARWARETDRQATARAGQAGLLRRFEAQIPASVTDPAERTRRALQLHRSHMQALALRRSRKAGAADARTA